MGLKFWFLIFISVVFSSTILFAQTGQNLDHFIVAAEVNSPLLNDYNNQIFSSKIDSLKLIASYGFLVSCEGSATYAPVIKGWGYDNALTNGQSLFTGLRIAKEFISRNNLQTRLKDYSISIAQILAQSNITRQSLRKQVTDQYIATYASQQQLGIAKEIIHLLRQEDIILKKLTQASVFKQTDYLNFKVNLQQNELALEQHGAEWQSNYTLLNYLCGIADTTFETLATPTIGNVDVVPFEQSVYHAGFLADSAKFANYAAIIQYDYKPKISAFYDGGYQSSLTRMPYKNVGLSLGVSVSLPLYDGHKKRMSLNQNQLQIDSRRKYDAQARRQYQQQIFQLQNHLNHYRKIITTAKEQIVYSQTLTEANAKQLPTGDVKMVDFILSMNNLLNLKSNIIQYNTNIYNLQNQLQYLIIQ